jgi:hypothetical protein
MKPFASPIARERLLFRDGRHRPGSWEIGRGGTEGCVEVPESKPDDHERGTEYGQF